MSTPFLGEVRVFSFNSAPKGWALCNGQLLPINQNQALFSLLGTTYGGNGQTNFALPDLRGRMPMHMGAGRTLG
ncbi:phage tail protein, partial [Glaesserella parasuis]|uniref:phage tail protein n=1 Tax=Glaesserella parasuis TaxID=738 RepID=UPI003B822F7B